MELERETVLHIAKLARIALTDDEIETFRAQLSEIIGDAARRLSRRRTPHNERRARAPHR